MSEDVTPRLRQADVERIARKADSAALDWRLQSDEPSDLIDDLRAVCAFALEPLSAGGSAPQPPDVRQLFRDHSDALALLREMATGDCQCCLVCRVKAWLFTEKAGGSERSPHDD